MTAPQVAAAPTRRGWVRLGWLAWVVVALLAVGLVVADFPYRFDQLRAYCLTLCEGSRLPPSEQPVLLRLGLTLDAYAVYTMALYLAQAATCGVVAALLMWRRSNDRMALLAAVMLVALGSSSGLTVSTVLPALSPVFDVLILAGFVSIVYLFYLFPDSRFVPGWSRWAFVPWILWLAMGIGLAVLHRPVTDAFWLVLTLLTLALFVLGGLAQIYRFARVSNPTQRQQTKWVVAGFALIIGFETFSTVYVDMIRPALGQPALSGVVFEVVSTALNVLALIVVPLSLGVAIFRHRLWDIDVIIRRTLVYSIITVLLALAYFASVLALQTAFGALTGQRQSPLVTVLSTLVIAALFVPLRSRVQAGIDRRFYRRHYDAARTLAAFGATLRDDVDLEGVTMRLVEVVENTMEPATVTLWIRSSTITPLAAAHPPPGTTPAPARRP